MFEIAYTPEEGMGIIAEMDIKKDSRNRITLPADLPYEHFRLQRFEDGHIELYPRVLVDPTISLNTLRDIDRAMANLQAGCVGEPLDVGELEALATRAES